LNQDSTEEKVAHDTPRAGLDTWAWIARARAAAARAVEPVAPVAPGVPGPEAVGEPAAPAD
jgi:hypothetical protein